MLLSFTEAEREQNWIETKTEHENKRAVQYVQAADALFKLDPTSLGL